MVTHSRGGVVLRSAQVALVGAVIAGLLLAPRFSLAADDGKDAGSDAGKAVVAPAREIPPQVRLLMQDRNYEQAIAALDEALREARADRAPLIYLKGRAQHFAGLYDAAIATFATLEREETGSPWSIRAQFARAVSLAKKGDYRGAEEIYRQQAERLLGSERKQEFADIYLEFADLYFKPPKEETPADYQKALDFYQKALEVAPPSDRRITMELQVARCYQKLNNPGEAIARFTRFIADHPQHALAIEARYLLGETQLATQDSVNARRTWEDLLAAASTSDSPRIAEARYGLAQTFGLPAPATVEDLFSGVAALQAFIKAHPNHSLVGQAQLLIAQSQIHLQRHDEAIRSLTQFLEDPRLSESNQLPEARQLLGTAYRQQKKFAEAISVWSEYLTKHPTHSAWSSVQGEIVQAEYLQAEDARDRNQYEQASKLWNEFLSKYPLDSRAPAIWFQLGQMHYDQSHWNEAIDQWRKLVSKYPQTEEASQAQFQIGSTLEEKLSKLAEALDEYRKCTWGSFAAAAQQRIGALTAKSLRVATERVFRSDEVPHIKVTTRNIEKVTLRAYRVDIETYFRKMHGAGGVENLDIALIDADKNFEFAVPNYQEHQQLENEVEIQLPEAIRGPGVVAVTVSSATLEATTLLIQSDLDIVTKSSRDELFVFGENMRTGKGWADVRLIVSDGTQILTEGKTGSDGVFRYSCEGLKTANDVRVLAITEGHMASNLTSLQGVQLATGLTDAGYVYTDRPVYRTGQLVNVRGVIRGVKGDTFLAEPGKSFDLEVRDERDRLLRSEKITINSFGTFHARFRLPAEAAPGNYRILVSDETHHYNGAFRVLNYQLEPVHLVVDTPHKVYYRGETITGTIRAEYYYGAPIANQEVRYQLANGRIHSGQTDAQGELKFSLETRDFREAQALPLIVSLPHRGLQTGTQFYLATHGFTIDVSTVRSVYTAGETFDVDVKTLDAEGKPVGQSLTLDIVQQTTVDGRVGQTSIEKRSIETKAEDGSRRTTLRLEKGATYVLRAEGTDRFGNRVSGESTVQISDDLDTTRLRILADRHTLQSGEQASVRIHWREQASLALVTFQGATVLDYRLVELQPGDNVITFPVSSVHAPNFDFAVSVMTDPRKLVDERGQTIRRFHEALSGFRVERKLKIQLEALAANGGKTLKPGDLLKVQLHATDALGKGQVAEISLGLVEQSLLDRFPASEPTIDVFFRGIDRPSVIQTSSSIEFAYHPMTRPINAQLLAETDRRQLAEEEATRLKQLQERGIEAFTSNNGAELLRAINPESVEERDAPVDSAKLDMVDRMAGRAGGMGFGGGGEVARGELSGLVDGAVTWADDFKKEKSAKVQFGKTTWDIKNATLGIQLQASAGDHDQATQLGALRGYYELGVTEAVVLYANGANEYLSLAQANGREGEVLIKRLAEQNALVVPVVDWQETGYWNPAIVTDADGRATLQLAVPNRSTAWRLQAKGITVDTQAGEALESLKTQKDLFGELRLPLAFTNGDQAQIPVVVHHPALAKDMKLETRVTMTWTVGDKTASETKSIVVSGPGQTELSFPVRVELPTSGTSDRTEAIVELRIEANEQRDEQTRSVTLLPRGMTVVATAAGIAQSDSSAWIEAPAEWTAEHRSLQILIGPSVERTLLEIVLPTHVTPLAFVSVDSSIDTTTSELLACSAMMDYLAKTQDAQQPTVVSLHDRIRSAIGRLVSNQNDDGGWSWTGKASASDRYSTARVVWAWSEARKRGFIVPNDSFDRAFAFLSGQVTQIAEDEYESKAILLHAMATAGRGDFALANRLYRSRPSLSNAALAHLALALLEMQRTPIAKEVVDLLADRNFDDLTTRRDAIHGCLPWNQSTVELRALAAYAAAQLDPRSERTKQWCEWLLSHRSGNRWSPDKATGPAALALGRHYATQEHSASEYQLTVYVNDQKVETFKIDPATALQTVYVPAKLLANDRQKIHFELTGRGKFTYQCLLSGFVPVEKLASTTQAWMVQRTYEPAPLEFDGQVIPRGFGLLEGNYSPFRNPLTQLPVGKAGTVELQVWRQNLNGSEPEEQLDYLVVTEPIPAGTVVNERSISGGFERYEISAGAITFFVGTRRWVEAIRYEIHGNLPGEFQAIPTRVYNAYRPDAFAIASAHSLTVLPAGSSSKDEYRLSPQELYELGKRRFERQEYDDAAKLLGELFRDWRLQADPYKETARMLLEIHLEKGPSKDVVRYFEILKEKWPDLEFDFAKIVKVGAAYDDLKEYERAYLIFRATIENSFVGESAVPAFLESQGEFRRSVEVMRKILAEYPPEPYAAEALYSLAQRIYLKAPTAADDPKLREQKIHRVDLVRQSVAMLNDFILYYPEDPAADQASFSFATALLELKAYREAIAACSRFTERYPKSKYLDSFWYITGYSHFALGEHDRALEMCRKVSEAKLTDLQGVVRESDNKWQAIYILGQVYHSLGKAAEAIAEYRRVNDRFSDAAEAIDYFTRKAITLPEITTVRPAGTPRTDRAANEAVSTSDGIVSLDLKFRNIAQCDIKVYRIDLLKYSLLNRTLMNVTSINLAGIRPYFEQQLELGNGQDYRDRSHKLELPLKEEGAYLVVCRGDSLHTSGLVLVSPLALEVQEEASSGRVRATLRDAASERFVADVHVKVIGSSNPDFVAGSTDLRGVFVADTIQGQVTVIAQLGESRYAFYRGTNWVGPQPTTAGVPGQVAEPGNATPADANSSQGQLLDNLNRFNNSIQLEQNQRFDKNFYQQNRKGVTVQEAY